MKLFVIFLVSMITCVLGSLPCVIPELPKEYKPRSVPIDNVECPPFGRINRDGWVGRDAGSGCGSYDWLFPPTDKPRGNHRVLSIIIDAISDARFKNKYKQALLNISNMFKSSHRLIHFPTTHTYGLNSPYYKLPYYMGVTYADRRFIRKRTSVWDQFAKAGYVTVHSDSICCRGPVLSDCSSGVISYWTVRLYGKSPAFATMDPETLCTNPALVQTGLEFSGFSNGLTTGKQSYNYIEQALEFYKDRNVFATINPNEEHSTKNYEGSPDELVQFISRVVTKNTIVFLVSDHGKHLGYEMYTWAGNIHNKLPTTWILYPKDREEIHHLRNRRHQFITPTNLYATMMEIGNGESSPRSLISNEYVPYRDYQDAEISDEFWACTFTKRVPTPPTLFASFVSYTDTIHKFHDLCKSYDISKFVSAECYGKNHLISAIVKYMDAIFKVHVESGIVVDIICLTAYRSRTIKCIDDIGKDKKLMNVCVCK